jgi:hypothetical protein
MTTDTQQALFDRWMMTLEVEVIQDEYGYEEGEFSATPELWRPYFDAGLEPSAAFKRALEAHRS